MQRREAKARIETLLSQELEQATGLRSTLMRERDSLTNVDAEALADAGASKQSHLDALEALEHERCQLAVSLDFGSDLDGMEALFTWCDAAGSLARRWEVLLQTLDECRAANTMNGAIVSLRRRQVRDALAVLRGDFPEPGAYSSTGATPITTPDRPPLAKV